MNRIRLLREERGMTQKELSKLLNVQDAAISKYENGKILLTEDTIVFLANYFGVSTDYLLGITDNPSCDKDTEWRLPHTSNRFGNILEKYRTAKRMSPKALSDQLGIHTETYMDIETGKYSPSMQLILKISKITKYDVDYLIGAVHHTSVDTGAYIESGNNRVPVQSSENDFTFCARFEELCMEHEINNDNCYEKIGCSPSEYIDLRYNRMPTLSELLRIAYAFNVSVDYLIGKTDVPISKLTEDEFELIMNYRDCKSVKSYQKNIRDRARVLSMECINKYSVAADEVLKKTGTDTLGK